MNLRLLKKLWTASSETVLTVVQVVVFFLAFMALLMFSFPRGSGLNNLYGDLLTPKSPRSELVHGAEGAAGVSQFIAVLSEVHRSVKERPADAIAWVNAKQGLDIADRHAIQTLDRSSATISFGGTNVLEMGENSVVIVRHPDRARAARDRRPSLVVLGGVVRGTVGPGTGKGVEIVTAQATTRVLGEGEDDATFAVSVNPDQSSTLSLFSGQAEIEIEGESVAIESNQAVTIHSDGTVEEPVQIPEPPRPIVPADSERIIFGATALEIDFRWAEVAMADRYRLRIALDPDFLEPVFDEKLSGNAFSHAGLGSGTYYWRVDAFNGMTEGLAGVTRKLEIFQDSEPPALVVTLPDEVVESDTLTIVGSTDPGSELLIGGRQVEIAADGSFSFTITLRPGPNLVVIESADSAGNIAYHSQYVHAKP
jgi:hypothetical protein